MANPGPHGLALGTSALPSTNDMLPMRSAFGGFTPGYPTGSDVPGGAG